MTHLLIEAYEAVIADRRERSRITEEDEFVIEKLEERLEMLKPSTRN